MSGDAWRRQRPGGLYHRDPLTMDRIVSTPNLSLREDKAGDIRTWLLDNWIYQNRPSPRLNHATSLPTMDMDIDSQHRANIIIDFNINEDDLDCPGHERDTGGFPSTASDEEGCAKKDDTSSWIGRRRHRQMSTSSSEGLYDVCSVVMTTSSSSEGLYDESAEDEAEEEELDTRKRAMSIDDDGLRTPVAQSPTLRGALTHTDDHSNNNVDNDHVRQPVVTFTFSSYGDDDDTGNDDDADTDSDDTDDSNLKTPTRKSSPSGSTFFKLQRRASFDNGVFGMPDRILRGEVMGGASVLRNAVTAPGTPADPGTPVGRYLSEDELMLHPELLFEKIHSLLCAERVTQMTKTYNDIEAVTRLLEEKERDLELAARIGQTLLGKNKELSCRGDVLDEQLSSANDKIKQLRHDLSMKDDLLRFYCADLQDQSSGEVTPGDAPLNLNKIDVTMLQKKVSTLEEENLNLRLESAQLHTDTQHFENKEKKLVEDCIQQLGEVNQQVEMFADELRMKTEESSRQKEEITNLLASVADLHKRVRELMIENKDLTEKLHASQMSQKQLTKELCAQHDKYDELFEMLEEAQDELRGHRNRNNPKATRHNYASAHLPSPVHRVDSLASELENSLLQEEKEEKDKKARNWKIFETARAARKAAAKSSRDSSVRMSVGTSPSSSLKDPHSLAPSGGNSDSESFHSDGYSADMDSMYGSCSELGRPGIPGSNDLESALKRLAMRRANEMNEREFTTHAQQDARDDDSRLWRMSHTPDSIASPASGYSYLGYSNNQGTPMHFKTDKLQIVKPLEGSVTLRHWQRLAQPHLGGLFEQREGVKSKGERKLDLDGEVYSLSDFEEDEDLEEFPSPHRRVADHTSTVYTFTNSVVSHPSDYPRSSGLGAALSPGLGGFSSGHASGTSTPRSQSAAGGPGLRRSQHTNTSSTYTMSLGLAAILKGREDSLGTRSLMRPVASCPSIPADAIASAGSGSRSGTATPTSRPTSLSPSSLIGAVASVTTADTQTPGLFGKLISTGYSLLWNKTDSPPTSTTPAGPSREGTPERKPTAEQIMPKGASTGVLSAIASFRKNGML